MTSDFHNRPEIQKLLETGAVTLTPVDVSKRLDRHITQRYPWVPVTQDSLDWKHIPGAMQIDIERISNEELLGFVRKTRLGLHDLVVILFDAEKPSFRCSLNLAILNLEVFTNTSVTTYIFGVDATSDGDTYAFDDFIEVDYDDRLIVSGISIESGP